MLIARTSNLFAFTPVGLRFLVPPSASMKVRLIASMPCAVDPAYAALPARFLHKLLPSGTSCCTQTRTVKETTVLPPLISSRSFSTTSSSTVRITAPRPTMVPESGFNSYSNSDTLPNSSASKIGSVSVPRKKSFSIIATEIFSLYSFTYSNAALKTLTPSFPPTAAGETASGLVLRAPFGIASSGISTTSSPSSSSSSSMTSSFSSIISTSASI